MIFNRIYERQNKWIFRLFFIIFIITIFSFTGFALINLEKSSIVLSPTKTISISTYIFKFIIAFLLYTIAFLFGYYLGYLENHLLSLFLKIYNQQFKIIKPFFNSYLGNRYYNSIYQKKIDIVRKWKSIQEDIRYFSIATCAPIFLVIFNFTCVTISFFLIAYTAVAIKTIIQDGRNYVLKTIKILDDISKKGFDYIRAYTSISPNVLGTFCVISCLCGLPIIFTI